jgi:hypothetical protein
MTPHDEAASPQDEAAKMAAAGAGSGPPRTTGIGRADPFAPLERKAAVKPPPEEAGDDAGDVTEPLPKPGLVHLEGIIWSPRQPHAVINETLVGVGETVAGWKVASIGREEVVLLCGGLRISLGMDSLATDAEKNKPEKPKERGNGS